ncbi:hypothetical protein O3M35_012700 [Rhynocoris fuscipes]|uniref:Uncharacterized protein n=1 Tax=Rhynocoris fuscipes TaxID=488301 RepID=A0AAW1CZQ5_9HEMI
MSAIRAFLLVGLVTLSSADFMPSCKDFPGKPNFNPEAFFKGIWYMTHSSPAQKDLCLSIKSEITGKKVHELYAIQSSDQTDYAKGLINLESFKGDGKFIIKMWPISENGTIADEFYETANKIIIDTDYVNYAVVYNCIIEGSPSEYDVMSRNPDPDQIHPNVELALKKIGMTLKDFGSTKGQNCPEVN